MSNSCTPASLVVSPLPHNINNTYICGINPFNSQNLLQKCCQGPVINITSPAPETGPLSDSWPATCLAYCAILINPSYSDQDIAVHENFVNCLGNDPSFFGSILCAKSNGRAPNECAPYNEVVGCTNTVSQTWDGGSYISGGAITSPTTTGLGSSNGSGIVQTVVVTRYTSIMRMVTATAVPSATSTESAATPVYRQTGILKAFVASLVVQMCLFSLWAF